MIKLVIKGERPEPPPERTVEFTFRRHKQAMSTRSVEQTAYLVGIEPSHGNFAAEVYPIKVDGERHIVEVRKAEFEKLGFDVIVRD